MWEREGSQGWPPKEPERMGGRGVQETEDSAHFVRETKSVAFGLLALRCLSDMQVAMSHAA